MTRAPNTMKTHSMKTHSRSFYFAGLMLPSGTLGYVNRLYAYCREMDDAVDELNQPEIVTHELAQLEAGNSEIQEVIDAYSIPPEAIKAFLSALVADTPPVRIQTRAELLQFCYGVAGAVGVMMCHILGVRQREALYHAIDLGIAMQLTNIARDRAEDAATNRHYFPEGLTQAALVQMAEPYYKSGMAGVVYLPLRVRPAIASAALIYREIGQKILRHPETAPHSRMVVGRGKKLWLSVKALGRLARLRRNPQHDPTLHDAISAYPCAHVR